MGSWEELNTHLQEQCGKRRERRLRGQEETIGERFERDRTALLPLPEAAYEACEKRTARVSSLSLVRYRGNDYSVDQLLEGWNASPTPRKRKYPCSYDPLRRP